MKTTRLLSFWRFIHNKDQFSMWKGYVFFNIKGTWQGLFCQNGMQKVECLDLRTFRVAPLPPGISLPFHSQTLLSLTEQKEKRTSCLAGCAWPSLLRQPPHALQQWGFFSHPSPGQIICVVSTSSCFDTKIKIYNAKLCDLPRHCAMVVLSARGPVGLFVWVKHCALHFSLSSSTREQDRVTMR